MKYHCPECAGCCAAKGQQKQQNTCVQVALEFRLENGKSVFVRMADWDGNMKNQYLASFMYRRKDGSLHLLAAIPRYILMMRESEKGPPEKTHDQVDMVLTNRTQAIAEHVYCCGQTYAYKTGVSHNPYDYEERPNKLGIPVLSASPDVERYCIPEGVDILDCLTEDHLHQLFYFDGEDW